MLSYFLKCKKTQKIKTQKFTKRKNGRIMLSSKFAVSGSKKLRFIKEQETKRFTALCKILPLPLALADAVRQSVR